MGKQILNYSHTVKSPGGATRHGTVLIGAFVAMSVLNYGFGVALSWFFTPEQFGVLGVAQSLLLLLALAVGSGFAWTTAHDVAASGVTGQTRHRFRAAWLANVVLATFLGGGLWLAYTLDWLPLGSAYRVVVPLVGLTAILLAARSVVNGVMRGLYQFEPLSINQVGEVIIKAGAGLALVAAGAGVAGVMAGFALGTTAAMLHSLLITRAARLWTGPGWVDRRVLSATAPLFVGLLGTALMLNLDILGLKLLSAPGRADELAGFYQAAVILARTPVFVAQSLSLVLFSYVARAKGPLAPRERGPSDYLEDALRAWFRLLLPAGLGLAMAPHAALSLFFPTQYQTAAPALRIAAVGGALLALVTLLTVVLQAAGDRRRPAMAASAATAVQVAILVWLVPTQGATGAAWSLVAAGVVALVGLGPALMKQVSSPPVAARGWQSPSLQRMVLPLLALTLPLLVLPDGARVMAMAKLGLAGLSYLVTLIITHRWSFDRSSRPVANLFSQFVHMLIGG